MNKNWIYLSYPLHSNAPFYGGGTGFTEKSVKSIAAGDSCNTSSWSISSHMRTHLDFPKHFLSRGKSLADYEPGFFILEHVHIAEISSVEPAQMIGPGDLGLEEIPEETELLLIKTGFGMFRGQENYSLQNPGFYPELVDDLRKRFPRLRIMGFDSISLSSFAHRELGHKAHMAFLNHEHSILPLEDVNLSEIGEDTEVHQVVVAPILVSEADGSPCTVMALVG